MRNWNSQMNGEDAPVERTSVIRTTGRNAAYSLGLSLGFAFALSLVYTLMSLVLDFMNNQTVGVGIVVQRIWLLFKTTSWCAAPIVFLISFALMQRFKLNPSDPGR